MDDTLKENEVLILNKLSYTLSDIERYDIVVIDESFYENENDKLIIKRIIGLPGESIRYSNNKLYINGKEESDIYGNGETYDFDMNDICNCSKIPEDKYLVLGDNREVSKDSRVIGLVDKKYIKGKANLRIFPLSKIGNVK